MRLSHIRHLPSLLAGLGLLLAAPALAANAPLAGVGPVSPVHPLPLWYQDAAGVQLEPCLDASTPNCALATGAGLDGHGFNPLLPIVFPTNFPDPINYYQLNTELPLLGNSRGLIYTANLQASFTGTSAAPTVFTQIRFVTAVNLTPNSSYTITHPYGVFTLTSDATGRLCPSGAKACSIIFPNPAPIGVFNGVLIANPSINPNDATLGAFPSMVVPPTGFVGDGAGRSLITGSPTGNNLVRIVGPGIGTNASFPCSVSGTNCIENRAFTVIGKRFSSSGGTAAFLLVSGLAAGSAGAPQTVTVRAVDVNGNTASTYAGTVHFASGDPQALLPADAHLTGGTGTFSVTPRTAGTFTLTATDTVSAGLTSAQSAAISPGPLAVLAIVSGDGQAAGVGAALPLPLTVKATDAFGNARPGTSISFAAPVGGLITPTLTFADASGLASASATLAPASGVQQFTASSAGVASATFSESSGLPGQPVALRLTALAAGVTAGAPASFTVTAIDAFGNAATLATGASGTLTFSSSDPAAVLPVGAQLTLGAGVFASTFKTSGTQSLTAALAGVPGATAGASTLVSPGAAASLSVTGLATGATAGVSTGFTVTARDAFGNLATSFAGTVGFTSTDPSAVLPGASALSSGAAAFSATFKTAGARTLTATIAGTPSATGSASTTVVAGPAARLAVASGSGQSGAVGAALPAPLVALVTDSFGNPVAGTTVAFSAPPTGSIAPASAVTGANGQASSIGTLPHGTGATSFGASVAGLAGSPIAFTATAAPGAPASLVLSGVPATTVAGSPFTVSVAVFDAFGNPATNFNGGLTFTSSDAGAVLPAGATLALGAGTYLVTLHGAGTRSLTCTVTGSAASSSASIVVQAGPASALVAASGGGQSGSAGVALAAPIVAAAQDAFGNPVSGVTVTFSAPAGGAVSPGSALTGAGGTASAVATLGGALGTQTFTASSAGLAGSPVAFAASAGPGPAATLTLTGLPASLAAGTVATLTVTAHDAFANVATGFTGTVGITSTDPAAALPASAPLVAGARTFAVTLKTTGSRTVTAAAQPASPGLTASASTTVGPAVAATLALVSSPSSSASVGTATASPVVVKVTDGLGNPVPGTTVAFAAPAGASISPASAATGADGTASATPTVGTTAGPFTFTATVSGLAGSPLGFSVTATAGAGAHLALQQAAGAPALDCGCYDLTVLLQDQFGNAAVQGLPGVSVTASGQALITQTTLTATGLPSASASGALSPNGTAQVRVCDSKPEQATVSVTAAGLTGSSLALGWTLGPADATASTFASDTATLVAWSGRAHLTVTPRSACGNPIGPGQTVVLGLLGPGSITPTVDAGNGSYTATVDVSPCPAQSTTQVTARVGVLDLPPHALAIACVVPSPDTTTVALSRTAVTLCDNPAKDQIDVTVTPKDAGGVAMGPGQSVSLAMTGLTGGSVTDAGDGTYSASFSTASCAAGSRPLTVRVNGVDLAVPGAALDFTCAPVDPARSGVSVPSAPVMADGRSPAAVTVAALNTCGDPARTKAVTLSASMGQLAAASGDTDAAGAFETSLSAAQAGTATVSASVDGVALPAGHVTFATPPAPHSGGGCSTGGGAGLLALLGLALGARRGKRR